MKLRKLFAMTIAAIMAVSTMGISVSAEGTSTATLMPGYTYNEETGELDFGYKYVEEVSNPMMRNKGNFTFAQTINSSYDDWSNVLVNTSHNSSDTTCTSRQFFLYNNNVFTVKFNDNISTIPNYYITIWNETKEEYVAQNLRFYAPSCYFSGLTTGNVFQIKIRVGSGNQYIAGSVVESKITQ